MKRVTCDACGTTVAPDSYGSAPLGWVQISLRTQKYTPAADYCSLTCAEQGLRAQAEAEREAALQAEVV